MIDKVFHIPLEDLAHIETLSSIKWVRKSLAQWDPSPITLSIGDNDRYLLRDGNHRLRTARQRGDKTIQARFTGPRYPGMEGDD